MEIVERKGPAEGAGEVLSRREAAAFLRVSVRTLDRLELPRVYVGRSPKYLRDDLLRFLAGRRVEPAAGGEPAKRSPRLSPRPGKASQDWLRSRLDSL